MRSRRMITSEGLPLPEYIEGTGGPIIDIRSNEILEPVENLKQIPVEEK